MSLLQQSGMGDAQYRRSDERPVHAGGVDHGIYQTWNWVTFCDPVTRESSYPVDPVTVFYNDLQMSIYVADKRLHWARGLPVFITVWRLHASGK